MPYTLDNVGMILFSPTSNMNLINATSLLVHFLTVSKFCVFVLCDVFVYVFYCLIFICNAVSLLSLCKHLLLSCVFYNKLTYLIVLFLLTVETVSWTACCMKLYHQHRCHQVTVCFQAAPRLHLMNLPAAPHIASARPWYLHFLLYLCCCKFC